MKSAHDGTAQLFGQGDIHFHHGAKIGLVAKKKETSELIEVSQSGF